MTVRVGELAPAPREPNRLMLAAVASYSLRSIQPKLALGDSSQDWTSLTRFGVELKT